MQIDSHINALREELQRVASLGDEKTARAAELLSVALESSLARRLQDILAEAALELNSQLADGHVEIRIAGRDLELVVVREDGSAPEAADEAFSARITLRLPESLKQRIESSAPARALPSTRGSSRRSSARSSLAAHPQRAATASPATAAAERSLECSRTTTTSRASPTGGSAPTGDTSPPRARSGMRIKRALKAA